MDDSWWQLLSDSGLCQPQHPDIYNSNYRYDDNASLLVTMSEFLFNDSILIVKWKFAYDSDSGIMTKNMRAV